MLRQDSFFYEEVVLCVVRIPSFMRCGALRRQDSFFYEEVVLCAVRIPSLMRRWRFEPYRRALPVTAGESGGNSRKEGGAPGGQSAAVGANRAGH